MRTTDFSTRLLAAGLLAVLGVYTAWGDEAPAAGGVVNGTWQHHHVRFSYYGITSLYTCSGLEDHVKSILLHFGARKDAKVVASGCAYGPDRPSRNAWIDANFDTLASTDSTAPEVVKAQWSKRELTPRRPFFMGDGDCELVDQMKGIISKNFSLRDVNYFTTCTPHQLNLNGFSVKAEALIELPQPKEAAAS
jgi:hypothetical protein